MGAQTIEQTERIGRVEFRRYVPAETLLPHCDWTICHGGQNTIIQSLLNGVPLLVFPGPIFERRFNARKVQEAEAGFMAEKENFNVEWLKMAIASRENSATRASFLGDRVRSYGGAPNAIAAMERAWQAQPTLVS